MSRRQRVGNSARLSQKQGKSTMNKVVLAAGYDLRIHAFDLNTGSEVHQYELLMSQANKLCSGQDSHFFACVYGYVYGYDVNSKASKPCQTFGNHEGNITDLICTQHSLVSSCEDRNIRLLDRRASRPSRTVQTPSRLNCLCYPYLSGTMIVTGGEDGFLYIVNMETSEVVASHQVSKQPIRSVSSFPDSFNIVCSTMDGEVVFYDIENLQFYEKTRIKCHNDYLTRSILYSDKSLLATCSADNTCKLWNTDTGEFKRSLVPEGGKLDWIWDAAFIPSSNSMCTAGTDGRCRIWDLDNGRQTLTLPEIGYCISALVYMGE